MVFELFICYYLYVLIYNLVNTITLYARFIYFIKDFIVINTIINTYSSYIEYIFNELSSNKNQCVSIEVNNKIFIVKLNNVYKTAYDITISTNKEGFYPLYTNIQNINMNPSREIIIITYYIFKNKLPFELIDYISRYICDCKSCKHIIYSIKM